MASNIEENDYVFHFIEDTLLLKQTGDQLNIPRKKDLIGCQQEGTFLFTLNSVRCFLVDKCQPQKNDTYSYQKIGFRQTALPKEIDWTSGVALHLKKWYSEHKYCGKCGTPTIPKNDERALMCPLCHTILYPNISPAIIVAILCNEKILLARNVHFPEGYYSLVAGYVDIGESIEDAVKREAKEEIGLEITNIRYYGSQPWPFSGSMMIGFVAEADEEQKIQIDGNEIAEAGWFSRTNLPNHPPNRSIAGEIIEKFTNKELF